jgi:hypothetical protein
MTAADGSCGGHIGIGEELRAAVLAALDRIDPALDRLLAEPGRPSSRGAAGACVSCPVCAVIAALRGERPELAVRLAEHAAGLVAVLRAALEEGAAGGTGAATPPEESEPATNPAPSRRVQRITVERAVP